jgi:hypothetical protein
VVRAATTVDVFCTDEHVREKEGRITDWKDQVRPSPRKSSYRRRREKNIMVEKQREEKKNYVVRSESCSSVMWGCSLPLARHPEKIVFPWDCREKGERRGDHRGRRFITVRTKSSLILNTRRKPRRRRQRYGRRKKGGSYMGEEERKSDLLPQSGSSSAVTSGGEGAKPPPPRRLLLPGRLVHETPQPSPQPAE